MKRILLAGTALLAITAAQPTLAADAPVYKGPPPAAAALFNWSGCYVGGHIGGGWGRKDVSNGFVQSDPFVGFQNDVDGFLGGIQGGCNYQYQPNWVIGIEGQISWSNIRGDFFRDPFLTFKTGGGFSARTDWLGTLALRLGYTWDRWMLYGKAGLARAHDKYSIDGTRLATTFAFSAQESRNGWMLGVGIEYALRDNWSAKLEYDYLDFGSRGVTLPGLVFLASGGVVSTNVPVDIGQKIHLIKFGLNYRF